MIINGEIYKRITKMASKFVPSELVGIMYDVQDGMCIITICDGFKIVKFEIECRDANDVTFISPVLEIKCKAKDMIDVSYNGKEVRVENLSTGDYVSGLALNDWPVSIGEHLDEAKSNEHLNISLNAGFLKSILDALPNDARLDFKLGKSPCDNLYFNTVLSDNKREYQGVCNIDAVICPIRVNKEAM